MKNNRRRGNKWELDCISALKGLFPKSISSRAESRARDAAKVDICNTGKFNFQCKNLSKRVNYEEVLSEMPDEGNFNVILAKLTEKKGQRFYEKGRYAILDMTDFIKILDGYIESNKPGS